MSIAMSLSRYLVISLSRYLVISLSREAEAAGGQDHPLDLRGAAGVVADRGPEPRFRAAVGHVDRGPAGAEGQLAHPARDEVGELGEPGHRLLGDHGPDGSGVRRRPL